MKLNTLKATCIGAVLAAMAAGPSLAETVKLKALGQPGATGLIQKNLEGPFFADFAERTGLDVEVSFQTLDQTGIKDAEELRILKGGLFDIVSLRNQQVSRDEPMLIGLDLVGQNPTYEDGRDTVENFTPALDKRLQEQFNTKLLGLWPFGPQVLFCNHAITGLKDLNGLKVRVDDQNLANFIQKLGGAPVPMGFSDVHQSLARGVVDCAITGPSSANSAAWPEVTTHVLPLSFKIAMQGYGMNLNVWNKFSPEEQAKIQAAFDAHVDEIWKYSAELYDDAMRCNIGETPCEYNKPYSLQRVEVSEEDLATVQMAVKEISFPDWKDICDKVNPECSAAWVAAVGGRFGL